MEEIETTVDKWNVQVPDASGKWKKVFPLFEKTIVETSVPQMEWGWRNTTFTPGEAIKSILTTGKRPVRGVFGITMKTLPGYAVLVDAQNYGADLLISWKVVYNKYKIGFFTDLAQDAGLVDTKNLSPSKEQDFNALKMITKEALQEAVRIFTSELDEDFSGEDDKSRGIETVPIDEPRPDNEWYKLRSSIWYANDRIHGEIYRSFLLGRTLDETQTIKGIQLEDRDAHFYIIGSSGTGKSKFLESLIAQDINNMAGFGVIDPHGDLVRHMMEALEYLTPHNQLEDRVVLIDPTDKENSVCLNPLEPIEGVSSAVIAGELVDAFAKIWGSSWGSRMQQILKNALIALIENNLTLREVPLILKNPTVRRRLLANVQEELCIEFFEKYEKWSEHDKLEYTESTLNKLDDFLANPSVRDIFISPKSSFNIRKIMDEGKVLMVNLDVGQLKGASDLLGSLIMSKIQMAAFSRSDIDEDERKRFYLYVDEFQNFADKNFIKVLDQSRKYGLFFTLAHQNLTQLDSQLRASTLSNCKLMACFQVSRDDSEVMAKELYGGVYDEPQEWEPRIQRIQKLGERQFIFKSGSGGVAILKTFDVQQIWQTIMPEFKTKEEYEEFYGEDVAKLGENYRRKRSDIRAEYLERRRTLGSDDEPDNFREKK
jgi:hypothetical protein